MAQVVHPDRLQAGLLLGELEGLRIERLVSDGPVAVQLAGEHEVLIPGRVAALLDLRQRASQPRRHRDRLGVGGLGRVEGVAHPVVVGRG